MCVAEQFITFNVSNKCHPLLSILPTLSPNCISLHYFLSLAFSPSCAPTHRRARGELLTPATWMRRFVTSHHAYQQDSIISPEIAHDLMVACKEIGEGTRPCAELLGTVVIDK